jgi:hypothetical protein
LFLKNFIGNRLWNFSSYLSAWFDSLSGGNWILLLFIAGGIMVVLFTFRSFPNLQTFLRDPVVLLFGIAGLFFLAGHRSSRYLHILLFLLVPLAIYGWSNINRKLVWLLVILVLAGNVYTYQSERAQQYSPIDWYPIIAELDSQDLRYGYSDFWYSYPITYLSNERIKISVHLNKFDIGLDRFPAYNIEVDDNSPVFVILPRNIKDLENIAQVLESGGIEQKKFVDQGLMLFSPIQENSYIRDWLRER